MTATQPANEWRQGWPMVSAGMIGMTVMALHTGPLGVLMKPLGDIYGWSRSEISIGLLIITVFQFALGPFVGALISRVGVRRVALTGIVGYAVGMAVLGMSNSSIWSWYLGWTVIGLTYPAITGVAWTTAVARTFSKHRGLALSFAMSGVGISTTIAPLITAFTFQSWGWRAPFFVLSGLTLLVAFPLLWWLTSLRPAFGPDGAAEAQEKAAAAKADGRSLGDLLRNPRVWQVVLAGILVAGSIGMVMAHFQAIMRDAGVSTGQAAAYYAVTGPSLIVGRLLAGVLLDRLPTRLVAAVMFGLPGVVCAILLGYDGSALWGFTACILFGLSYGAEGDVFAYLTARYFGTRHYPVIFGIIYGTYTLGFGVAPVLAGAIYDLLGSYDKMLYGLIAGVAVGVVLVTTLGRDKPPAGGKLTDIQPDQESVALP